MELGLPLLHHLADLAFCSISLMFVLGRLKLRYIPQLCFTDDEYIV